MCSTKYTWIMLNLVSCIFLFNLSPLSTTQECLITLCLLFNFHHRSMIVRQISYIHGDLSPQKGTEAEVTNKKGT